MHRTDTDADHKLGPDIASIPLAGVSTIACIVALGVLLYYKMWRTFIYRLVLYLLISLLLFSLSTACFAAVMVSSEVKPKDNLNNITTRRIILIACQNACLEISFSVVTCLTVSLSTASSRLNLISAWLFHLTSIS